MKASRRHKLLATSETNCSAKESKVGGVESPLVLLNGRFFLFFGLLVLFRRFSLREELREGGRGEGRCPAMESGALFHGDYVLLLVSGVRRTYALL